jgi:hypothetical protein
VVTNAEDTLIEVDSPAERVEHGIRYAIAGHERGAIRRILLYGVVAMVLVSAVDALLGAVGVGALLLLALTDNYA